VSDDPARTWRRRRRRLRRRIRRSADVILFLLVIVVVVAIVVNRSSPQKKTTATTTTASPLDITHPKGDDVRVTACRYENYAATAYLKIANHVTEDMNYVVEIAFKDGKQDFADGIASTDHLPAGRVAHVIASGISTDPAPRHLLCEIARIERFR
jgi:hypothetical protein